MRRQETDPDSVLNAYRAFLHWRRGVPALRTGNIRLFESEADTLVFVREHASTSVLACFNFGAASSEIRIPPHGSLLPLVGHGFAPSSLGRGAVTVPAHGAFFATLHNEVAVPA